ncbi:MAG: hypothetical protein FWC32_00395 [Firmicutes bacterium]|nr:hypothetical protein [Bacillota bacterium]
MNKVEVENRLVEIIRKIRPDIQCLEGDLFSTKVNCSHLDVVYILLEIKEIFGIDIDDNFVERLRETTVSCLAEAVFAAS